MHTQSTVVRLMRRNKSKRVTLRAYFSQPIAKFDTLLPHYYTLGTIIRTKISRNSPLALVFEPKILIYF